MKAELQTHSRTESALTHAHTHKYTHTHWVFQSVAVSVDLFFWFCESFQQLCVTVIYVLDAGCSAAPVLTCACECVSVYVRVYRFSDRILVGTV